MKLSNLLLTKSWQKLNTNRVTIFISQTCPACIFKKSKQKHKVPTEMQREGGWKMMRRYCLLYVSVQQELCAAAAAQLTSQPVYWLAELSLWAPCVGAGTISTNQNKRGKKKKKNAIPNINAYCSGYCHIFSTSKPA